MPVEPTTFAFIDTTPLEHAEMKKLLELDHEVTDTKRDGTIMEFSIPLWDDIECDLKLVNSGSGPYLDCVLFEDGHEIGCAAGHSLEDIFEFDLRPGINRQVKIAIRERTDHA
jgi:hypothetical protein